MNLLEHRMKIIFIYKEKDFMEYLQNVVSLKLNKEECIGCKMCINVCPHEVFTIEDKKAVIMRKDSCMECGACAQNCPSGAIEVKKAVG